MRSIKLLNTLGLTAISHRRAIFIISKVVKLCPPQQQLKEQTKIVSWNDKMATKLLSSICSHTTRSAKNHHSKKCEMIKYQQRNNDKNLQFLVRNTFRSKVKKKKKSKKSVCLFFSSLVESTENSVAMLIVTNRTCYAKNLVNSIKRIFWKDSENFSSHFAKIYFYSSQFVRSRRWFWRLPPKPSCWNSKKFQQAIKILE